MCVSDVTKSPTEDEDLHDGIVSLARLNNKNVTLAGITCGRIIKWNR
jgi:hypothetical protein